MRALLRFAKSNAALGRWSFFVLFFMIIFFPSASQAGGFYGGHSYGGHSYGSHGYGGYHGYSGGFVRGGSGCGRCGMAPMPVLTVVGCSCVSVGYHSYGGGWHHHGGGRGGWGHSMTMSAPPTPPMNSGYTGQSGRGGQWYPGTTYSRSRF